MRGRPYASAAMAKKPKATAASITAMNNCKLTEIADHHEIMGCYNRPIPA